MPTPQEAAAILRRFLAASGGSDIQLPRDPTPLDSNRLPPSWQSDDDFERQVIADSPPARNPRRTDLTPLDTNRLPPSSQSDDDFEQQVIAGSEPRRNPRTLPYPAFDPSNSFHTDPPVRMNPLDTNRLPESSARPPADANSGRVALARMFGVDQPPPDPRASAAILRDGPMRANDPQALARNRYSEADELERRITNETSALAMPPSEGFVPGEPGRRYLTRGVTPANLVSDRLRLGRIRGEQAADPFTGDAETARIGGINSALDAAAQTQRPEIGDAADTVAKRNAFATFLKERGLKMGDYEAASSPAAQAAAMVPINANASDTAEGIKDKALRREQELKMSPQLVPGQLPDDSGAGGLGGFTLPPNYKPLNAADSNAIQSMAKAAPMVGDLERMLDPNANQITNKTAQSAKWAMYNMGVSPNLFGDAKAQARLQLSSLIKIVGSSPYMTGSRNYRYLQDVQRHLTDPSATDQFLLSQISELKKRWPEMQKAIIQTHIQPGTALNFGGDDPWAAPPSPDEISGGRRR